MNLHVELMKLGYDHNFSGGFGTEHYIYLRNGKQIVTGPNLPVHDQLRVLNKAMRLKNEPATPISEELAFDFIDSVMRQAPS